MITSLIKRNLKIFFRDKTAVFFSLLAVFIVIGLYILFLGNVMVQNYQDIPEARFLLDSWIMAGLLGVTTVTTTMGALGVVVQDKATKIYRDFKASPISRQSLIIGYASSSLIIGLIMTTVAFILAEIYIVIYGGSLLSLIEIAKVVGIIVLSLLSSNAIVFFLVSFFSSNNAFATASSIIGSLIGFLAGVYIPIGILPSAIQPIVKLFPPFHSTVLFRQVMMKTPINRSLTSLASEYILGFKTEMGVIIKLGSHEISPLWSVVYLIIISIIFYFLGMINLMKKDK